MSQHDKLKELALAATALNLDTAETVRDCSLDEEWDCPLCDGDGYAPSGQDYCNIDSVALGVQFYGIGNEYINAENYFRAANPAAILSLIAQRDELLAALKLADEFITNGIELGFIHMGDADCDDPAHQIPGIVSSAIAKAVQP